MESEEFDKFYLSLPEDPNEAFIVFQKQKFSELEDIWNTENSRGWQHERTYVNAIFAFDEVFQLGILDDYGIPPDDDNLFASYFQPFRRQIDKVVIKYQLEQALRARSNRRSIVKLDTPTRNAIRALINALRGNWMIWIYQTPNGWN